MRPGLVLALLFAAAPPRARADAIYQLVPSLELGGGADTDPSSDATTTGRGVGPSMGMGMVRGGERTAAILHVAPRAAAHLAGAGHRVDVDYEMTLRAPSQGDLFTAHAANLGYRLPRLGRLELAAGLQGELTRAGDLGTAQAGGSLALSCDLGRTRLTASGRAAARRDRPGDGSEAAGSSLESGFSAELRPARGLALVVAYGLGRLASQADSLDETRQRASLAMRWAGGRFDLLARYGFSYAVLPHGAIPGARRDQVHDAELAAEVALTPAVDLFVRAQASHQASDDGSRDTRVLALAGLAVHLEWTRLSHAAPRPAVEVVAQHAHFRLRAPAATSAAVIGDFNGWDPASGVMSRNGADFELELDLAPGRYAWSFQVDGQPVLPAGVTVSDDGFGGQSAILVIE